MFSLSFSKLLLTVLVIVAVWRGFRLFQQWQARIAAANEPPLGRPRAAAKATDLVECPRCGLFVPNGTVCRSRAECRYRRG